MSCIFTCDACHEEILAEKPCIHCQICPSYSLCANCYVCEKCTGDHVLSHTTILFEMSGYLGRPPPMPPRPPLPQSPAAAPKRRLVLNPNRQRKIPVACTRCRKRKIKCGGPQV
ncbi:hypothetical protein VE00_09704 [Pseudogymnoascus sp. WSF 3629]|nr:hypothetical protein VE00_09704 [Pseudogymnoascus sp. WSF 3629]